MDTTQIITQLRAADHWGYHPNGPMASEPAAWACLALSLHGEPDAAATIANWLAQIQQPCGAVGVTANQLAPTWPTGLAILAWESVAVHGPIESRADILQSIRKAVDWSLTERGNSNPREPHIGHDTTIVGWSWAAQTHSWIEPTCFYVLALRAAGHENHPRVQEGLRLLTDRLLPTGGCNYGNTQVLGQTLLPHLQPTGLAMMALAGTSPGDNRVEASLRYLATELQDADSSSRLLPTASLCFGLLGLAAHHRRPAVADRLLQAAYAHEMQQEPSTYKLALLALASKESWGLGLMIDG